MKIIEIESTVDQQGKLAIPARLMDDMGLMLGDTVRLTYISKSPEDLDAFSKFIITPSDTRLEEIEPETGGFSLPNELLEAADIPLGSDIDIVCAEGTIIITAGELLDIVPNGLCQLFSEMNISPETVRRFIKSGGVWDGQ